MIYNTNTMMMAMMMMNMMMFTPPYCLKSTS